MAFQKIATKRKSTQVAEQIADAIRLNTYKVGDRLPSERVIAEQMGVSRPSVREALSALQIVGVLESRVGDGTYVVSLPDGEDAAVSLLEKEESPVEALEARRIMECAIARAVAPRMTADVLRDLARALGAMRTAADARDYDAFAAANGPFHQTIIRVLGNDLLERTAGSLVDVMTHQLGQEMRRREYAPDGAFFDAMYAAHERIYDALYTGDASRAADAMDRHFDLIEASLRG